MEADHFLPRYLQPQRAPKLYLSESIQIAAFPIQAAVEGWNAPRRCLQVYQILLAEPKPVHQV